MNRCVVGFRYVVASAIALACGVAMATDYVWTGAGSPSDQWQIPGNWSVNGEACTDTEAYPHTSGDTATFNTSARVLVASQTTIGELIIGEGAAFMHVRDQYLKVGMLSGAGTLKLQNRARFDFVNASEITVTTPIEVSNNDNDITMLIRGTNKQVNYNGSLSGSGTIQFEGNVKFGGNNSSFTGTLKVHPSSTVSFLDAKAGFPNGTLSYSGNNKKTERINVDGDIHFGAFQQTVYGAVDFRVNLSKTSQCANIVIGGNGVDSVIMGSWGDANNGSDRPNSYAKITKVGTETLKVYQPWHRLGTVISNGVLEAIGPDALSGRKSIDISPIAFMGGTLKYGLDETTDSANPKAVTTDWSSLVKNSTDYISVDTGTNDVTWASQSLYNNNNDANGFVKKGVGTLSLTGTNRDGSWKFFNNTAKTNKIEAGTLEIMNAKYNSHFTLESTILGTGTLRILSSEHDGAIWLQGTEALKDFEGTLDWNNELTEATYASGFMMTGNVNFEMPKAKMVISGNPSEALNVMRGETQRNPDVAHVTVGAYDHLYPNAIVDIERSAWTLNILGTAGDSYLNGTFGNSAVKIVKTGAGKITIGPDFSAPSGSTLTVNEGAFELPSGLTQETVAAKFTTMTIANGVALCGEGTFGAVDLSKYDLVFPVTKDTADKAKTYTLLSAKSLSGDYTATVKAALAALNNGETKGRWKLSQVTSGDNRSVRLSYAKFGFMVIFK